MAKSGIIDVEKDSIKPILEALIPMLRVKWEYCKNDVTNHLISFFNILISLKPYVSNHDT